MRWRRFWCWLRYGHAWTPLRPWGAQYWRACMFCGAEDTEQ